MSPLPTKLEQHHASVVDDFLSWCDQSILQLSVAKTQDMTISYRNVTACVVLASVKDVPMELVDSLKKPKYC